MDNGWSGYNYQRSGSGGIQIALRDRDYEEEEVWGVLDDKGGRAPTLYYEEDEPRGVISKAPASEAKRVPRRGPGSGDSRAQRSVPVNVSYWPKKSNAGRQPSSSSGKKKEPRDESEDDDEEDMKGESEEEEEDAGRGRSRLPPHELIARRLARSHISSFSVFEGVGRKLKGRDLAKVRRAVLTRTGFLESQ